MSVANSRKDGMQSLMEASEKPGSVFPPYRLPKLQSPLRPCNRYEARCGTFSSSRLTNTFDFCGPTTLGGLAPTNAIGGANGTSVASGRRQNRCDRYKLPREASGGDERNEPEREIGRQGDGEIRQIGEPSLPLSLSPTLPLYRARSLLCFLTNPARANDTRRTPPKHRRCSRLPAG